MPDAASCHVGSDNIVTGRIRALRFATACTFLILAPSSSPWVQPDDADAMRTATSWLRRAGLTLATLVAAVTLGSGPSVAQAAVRFSLNWKFEGPSAPYVLALDSGYYGAHGLDVTIEPAMSSIEALHRVASGAFDMGVGDINALIRFRDQNPSAPVTAVFMVHNRPAFSIVGRKSRGVVSPLDLPGKKIGAPAADLAFAQWPIFLKANGIDRAAITLVNIGAPVREPMLASGEVDAIVGYSFATFINLKDRGVPSEDITLLLMADYGVDLYGDAIMVNSKFASEKPEVVKAFLAAFVKSLRAVVRNPESAVESVVRRNEDAKKEVELERLRLALRQNIVTPEVKLRGFGNVDPKRFDNSIDLIGLAQAFKSKPKGADVFDPSFLPDPSERKVH
jgi:NitT/TauT family transport system substrate-binding protein